MLLSKLIGRRPLRPPPPSVEPPAALLALPRRRPAATPPASQVPDASAGLADLELVDPSSLKRDRRAEPHWDDGQWHDGPTRGLASGGRWLWLCKDDGRWWALAGDPSVALLRHDRLWWTKTRGVWFVVHDGAPWAWRSFRDWDAQGLFQPGTGTEMVYSRDFSRVALITPGRGAVVFDAESGAELARIPEERMPGRRRPKVPEPLQLPW